MTAKEELLEYVQALTPEQVDKIISRLDLVKQCLTMTEPQAIYTKTLTGKLFAFWDGREGAQG